MTINGTDVKADFPMFQNNPKMCYLDSSATSLKPKAVIAKMQEYYEKYGVNIHRGVYQVSSKASDEYEETREVVANFLHAEAREIVFTRGTTESLNLVAMSYGLVNLKPGDEIITSELEHHSSFMPWQYVAEKTGAVLKFVPLDEDGRITPANFQTVLSPKTKVVALTYLSNVLGYFTPIETIAKLAHEVGAICVVDAAQAAPHILIDVKELDVDFLAFSAHKMLGPTGLGILYGKYHLLNQMQPTNFGGDMNNDVTKEHSELKDPPYRFEGGTPAIAEVIAFKEAIRYLEKLDFEEIRNQNEVFVNYTITRLQAIPNLILYNNDPDVAIFAFNVKGVHPHDVATYLDNDGVCVRAGHHCAQLTSKWLGVNGTLRASMYIYNDLYDIDRLIASLKGACEFFKDWGEENDE